MQEKHVSKNTVYNRVVFLQTLLFDKFLVEVNVGKTTIHLKAQYMVLDASRYEDRPIWGKCSDRCFGKTWNPIHGKDKIYSPNEHWMFFNEKGDNPTVYISKSLFIAEEEILLNKITAKLYEMFCRGKLKPNNTSKTSSGKIDFQEFIYMNNDAGTCGHPIH